MLSLDISSDSKMIVTSSADKNVKIWGMDFGDCHRSIFAHDDSVMQVAFEKDSHYFWTVGKDSTVKYWDGDKVSIDQWACLCLDANADQTTQFELIQKLDGHHGEVWALAVSNRGEFVVTGSHDKSLRVWEKTEEPLFLEEEREREIERAFDENMANDLNRIEGAGAGGDDLDGEAGAEAEAVQKTTAETLMAGEQIMDALEVADADRETMRQYEEEQVKMGEMGANLPKPTRNPELVAKGDISAVEHVMGVLRKVPAASMEDALLVLPFRQVVSLLGYLDEWASAVSSPLLFVDRARLFSVVTGMLTYGGRTATLSSFPAYCTFCSARTHRKSRLRALSAPASLHSGCTSARRSTRNARPWATTSQQ